MRIASWLIGAIGLLGLGGGAYYYLYLRHTDDPLWRLVPPNASVLYAHPNGLAFIRALDTASIWHILSAQYIQARNHNPKGYALRDQLIKALIQPPKELQNTPIRISLHAQDAHNIHSVFYIQCATHKKRQLIQQWLAEAAGSAKIYARPFEGVPRYEMRLTGADSFYFFFQDEYWIGSFSAVLIEDAIHWRLQSKPHPLASQGANWQRLWDDEKSHWYVHYASSWALLHKLRLRRTDSSRSPIPAVQGTSSLSQNTPSQSTTFFASGTSLLSNQRPARLMAFDTHAPLAIPFARLIPTRTLSVLTYQFQDPVAWNRQMIDLWTQVPNGVLDARIALFARYNIDLSALFSRLGTQVSVLHIEDEEAFATHRLLLLHVSDKAGLKDIFQQYARALGTTPFADQYRGYAVQYVDIQELPQWLFGTPFAGFSGLFYVFQNDVLIAGASLEALRSALDDIEEARTWGQTPVYASQYAHALARAHISWWVNANRAPRHLISSLKGPLKAFVAGYTHLSRSQPALWGMQWQRTSTTKAYTQWIAHPPALHTQEKTQNTLLSQTTDSLPSAQAQNALQLMSRIRFLHPIRTKPLLVYHPQKRNYMVFLQDDTYQLYALSDTRIVWRTALKSPLVSPVYAIDIRQNNQTQYLCATSTHLHLYEEDGQAVAGFPRAIPRPATRIQHLTLVDYAKNKNYRYFIATADGGVWITDKKGLPLEGWRPKQLEYAAAHAPFHVRIGTRDVMGIGLQNGSIHLYRRNGNPYPNFPYALNEPIHHSPVIQKGPDLARSYLILMTQGGRYLKLSMTGQLVSESQQYRPTANTRFQLVKDVLGKGYIGLAYDADAMRFFTSEMQPLFTLLHGALDAKLTLQYYQWSETPPLITWLDPKRDALYFYHLTGKSPLPPLKSAQNGIAILYNAQQKYTIHQIQGNEYTVWNAEAPQP